MAPESTDKRIINTLIDNSRLSMRQISKKAKVSVATVMNHMNKLEKEGMIKKFTCVPDYEKLGYDMEVMIEIRVSHGKPKLVENRLATHPNVFAIYDITGDFDIVVLARFPNRRKADDFIKKIQTYEFVERVKTKLILNTIKEEPILIE